MTNSELPSELSPPANYILHPTDFSSDSEFALAHALRLALSNRAQLDMLHVGKGTDDEWDEFPSVRQLLAGWGVIDQDAAQADVTELGIGIKKSVSVERSVVSSVEAYCQRHPIDLIVMSTSGRQGIASWIKPSTAERVAGKVADISIPTLFVPAESRGCVDVVSGKVNMEHVLVPIDHSPSSESAVERGLRAISQFGGDQADLTLLHVGTADRFPHVELPDGSWNVKRVARDGNPAGEILAVAKDLEASLIIMVTDGEHGLLDVLRGTTTEQVLRQAPCPVLAVPAQS